MNMYNAGWSFAKDAITEAWLPDHILSAHPNDGQPFNAGVRDCVAHYLKTGNCEMIKIASCVVVVDPDTGKVLACTRRGTTDDWGIIGGKTDGEDPTAAAVREFQEETGHSLIAVPDYIGCFRDDGGWAIHCFIVTDRIEAKMICDSFRSEPREVEKGILVGLVDYPVLMEKTFADFNKMLLTHILKELM